MRTRRDCGAVDEDFALGADEQRITLLGKDGKLRRVIGDNGENHVGRGGDFGERAGAPGANFTREAVGTGGVNIVNGGDRVVTLFEAASHIGSHATDSNKSNAL